MLEADVEIDRRDFTVAVALRVAPGERLALFGPSGSGKTTTLETIAGLVSPQRGHITLAGRVLTQTRPTRRSVPVWQRRVGLLRQDPGLFPHLTVRQNLSYGTAGRPGRGELTPVAERLEIDGLLDEYPSRLSGGQAHRVALGRLLLAHCDALLLDEPYTGLDSGLQRTLNDLVRELVAQREMPAVLVAHELPQAQAFADRITVLDRGRVLATGSPSEVVARPASRRVARLVGYQGFVPVTGYGPHAVAGVHPERVLAGAQPARGPVLAGKMLDFRPVGAGWEARVRVGDEVIWCRLPDRPREADGDFVITLIDPPCFGPDGMLRPCPDKVRA